MKAVNMKGYKFSTSGGFKFTISGFGILDEETGTFASFDGRTPYVLRSKKLIQSCIEAGWTESMKRVTPAA